MDVAAACLTISFKRFVSPQSWAIKMMKSQRQAQQQSATNQEWMMFIDIHSQEYLLNRNKTKRKKKQEQREGKMDTTIRQSRKKKQFFFLLFFFSFCTSHNWELYICFLAEGVGFTLTISSIVNSEELHIQIQSGERGESLSSFGSKLVICKRRWRNWRENRGDKGGTWKEPIRQSGIRPSTQTPKSAGNRLSSSAIFQ